LQKAKSNMDSFRYFLAASLVTSIALGATSIVFGQNENTVHVFPQVVDGRQSDGSVYRSVLIATNLSPTATSCTFTTTGLPVNRFAGPTSFTLSVGYTQLNITTGTNSIVSGFGTLRCSQPVQASLIYTSSAPTGVTSGMATVFSAPRVTYAGIPVLSGTGLRFGIAIANTASTPITMSFLLNLADGTTNGRTVQVPADSQMVRFVDELVAVPSVASLNIFEISSSSQFYVTGLMFDGAVFTTLVPATLP